MKREYKTLGFALLLLVSAGPALAQTVFADGPKPPNTVYASLPSAAASTGKLFRVTDCSTAACTAGGGSTQALLMSNGSTWQLVSTGSEGGGGTCWHNLNAQMGNTNGYTDGYLLRSGTWFSSGSSATGVTAPASGTKAAGGLGLLDNTDVWTLGMPWPRNCTPGTGFSVTFRASKNDTNTTSLGLAFVCTAAGSGANNPSFPAATTQELTAVGYDNAALHTFTIDTSACENGGTIWFRLSKTGTDWALVWGGEFYK